MKQAAFIFPSAVIVAAGLTVALTSCTGSWAQDTHVVLAAIAPSPVRGDAELVQAVSCYGRRGCVATEGSDILLTLAGTQSHHKYQIVLAEGKCGSSGPRRGTVVATAEGGTLARDGIRIHVETFIHTLTKTDYILLARDAKEHVMVACGSIASEAIY